MAVSQLAIAYDDLATEGADYLGYKLTDGARTSDDNAHLKRRINQAYRKLLNAHTWRFLKPSTSIILWPDIAVDTAVTVVGGAYSAPSTTITATGGTPFYPSMVGRTIVITGVSPTTGFVIDGYTSSTVISVTGDASAASADTFSITNADSLYRLPADHIGINGDFAIVEQFVSGRVKNSNEARVRQALDSSSGLSGRPQEAALQPVPHDGTSQQRWDLAVFPHLDSVRTLSYQYIYYPPTKLDTSDTIPIGGPHLAEALTAALLSVIELKDEEIREGPMEGDYQKQIAAAVRKDIVATAPEFLGKNVGGHRSRRDIDGRNRSTILYVGGQQVLGD